MDNAGSPEFASTYQKLVYQVLQIGVLPGDDIDSRLQKSMFVIFTGLFAMAGLSWGVMYFALGAPTSALIPFSYGIFGIAGTVLFAIRKDFRFYRGSQLFLTLMLPFLLMLSLGGYRTGSAVILWGLTSPMGALMFASTRAASFWFLAYVATLIFSAAILPITPLDPPLSDNVVTVFFVLNMIGVSSLVFTMVLYFVHKKNGFQEQSEALLLNILPKAIADELKEDHHTIAEHYDGASVLFADLVDFTPLSSKLSPIDLVNMLNSVFSEFDEMVEAYGLEKIKTIGDCYMVAAGVPARRADHAAILVRLALDMQKCVSQREFGGQKLEFRIGINSGPLVAGVIGKKKFIYDLWGDSVNTASRMESHGEGGRIQVTKDTLDLVADAYSYEFRGTVNLKGKGPTDTWYITGPLER